MLKVVLIDDKKSIVEGMKYLIDWEQYGYEIAAALRCAADAISFVEQNHVDLIISDIRMPGITGLELIGEVRRIDPRVKFIIMSGYAEFEYAKAALDYQANGYLLKPVDEEELIGLLCRIRNEISDENKYIKHQRDEYIQKMLSGDTECGYSDKSFENDDGLRYILIHIFDEEIIASGSKMHNAEAVERVFEELSAGFAEDKAVYISKNDKGCIELIIGSHVYGNNIKRYCMNIENRIKKAVDNNFVILVGEEADCVKNISRSRDTARKAGAAAFYNTEKHIFVYDLICDISFAHGLSEDSFYLRISDAIKNSGVHDVERAVDEFCRQIKAENVNPKVVFVCIYNIFFDIGNRAGGIGGDVVKFFYRYSMLKNSEFVNFEIVSSFLKENAVELQELLGALKLKNSLGVVGEIVDYLKEHYMDADIKLQKIADNYYINSAYLGKMFKERMGKSFNAYLLDIRIEASKELLKNNTGKIYEIAHEVGFNDPNYFYVKFAEKVNMTPAAYRESFNKKNNSDCISE